MPNDLAKQTISTIEKGLQNDEHASAINDVIQIIQELASKAFSISVSELSQLISRDASVTEKVISSANTLGFNPSGAPITTITQAIHTIGFEKIRNLSISILLVENAGKKLNSDEQKEMAAMSVCSGLMAQQLIDQLDSDVDPEFAFVCSSLRNYGKLLMTTFLVDDYKEAKSIAQNTDDYDNAFREVFGLTPLVLGQILLKSSNLPKNIMNSLKEVTPAVLEQAINTEEEQICVLADFCVKVCETTFDDTVPPESFNGAVEGIIEKFGKVLPVSLDMVNMSLIQIDSNISVLNKAVGIQDTASDLSLSVKARVVGRPLPRRANPATPSKAPPAKPTKEDLEKEEEKQKQQASENRFNLTMDLLLRERAPGDQVNLREIYQSMSETILTSLDVESCMVFVEEVDVKAVFAARYGHGRVFKGIKNRPVVSVKNRDVFSICLARKEDILIQDINAGKIKSVIPDWLSMYSEAKSIALLPIKENDELFALIFCSGNKGQTINLDKNDLRRLKSMKNSLSKLKTQLREGVVTAIS